MQPKPSSAELNVAFYSVLIGKWGMKQHFGRWVLLDFWAYHVNERLSLPVGTVKSSKLLRAIENDFDTALGVTASDKEKHGIVTKIKHNSKRLAQRRTSILTADESKKRHFVFVETSKTKACEVDGPLLQKSYEKYANMVERLRNHDNDVELELGQGLTGHSVGLIVDTELNDRGVEITASRGLIVDAELEAPHPRPVTPTGSNNLDKDENVDIRNLLEGIINPDLLTREDLFASSDSLEALRPRIKELGCRMREEEIKLHYNRSYYMDVDSSEKLASLDPIKNRFLVLTERFGIPLLVPAIHDILTAIINIAEEVPGVLELAKFGGSIGLNRRLIKVTPSTTQKRLYYNLKACVQQLVVASVNEDSEIASYHVLSALATVIANMDEQAFRDVSKSKDKLTGKRMDALTQKALLYDAALTSKQFALIRKYIIVTLGYNIFQPSSLVKQLDVDFFPAISIEFRDGPRKRLCHYRPVDKLFKWSLDKRLASARHKDTNFQNLSTCHILIGGDHGQGAFRMVATLLLFSKGTTHPFQLELEEDHLVGFIECKKETYDTIEKTVGSRINDSLKACGEELVFLRDDDGNTLVEWGAQNAAANMEANPGTTIIGHAPVEMFMVGDLAYQVTCQGREGASTWWCAFCQLGWNQWQKWDGRSNQIGRAWTPADMDNILTKIEQAGGPKKLEPVDRKGISKKRIFDAIPMGNYIVPVLHALDLFANKVKDNLDLYIDHRLEDRPMAILEARVFEAEQRIEERKAFKSLQEAEIILEAAIEVGDAQMITDANEEVAAQTVDHKRAAKSFGKAAADARKVEKKKEHGALSQTLRQEIDQILAEKFHILRSSYHGGDYEGNHCRKLMRRADAVMNAIEEKLLTVPREKRARGCDDSEVKKYCRAFKRMFQYMDVLSHYCYQPYGAITDPEMQDIKLLVNKMDKLFRKLAKNTPPKVHAWQHLVEHLDRFRGLKHHHESKIEVSHQVGRKTDLRFRAMAGCGGEKKVKCTIQFQANLEDSIMQDRQNQIQEGRRRKFGKKAREAKALRLEESKRFRDARVSSIIHLPEIAEDGFLKNMLELTVGDQEQQGTNPVSVA